MNRRRAAATLAAALVVSACGGITDEATPGDSMAKLCDAARALAAVTGLSDAAIASIEAGDRLAAADLARRADLLRQDGAALTSWAGQLEARHDPPGSPGYDDRLDEVYSAQQAVDLLVGVLGEPAAPVTVEARPRLLAAARDAVGRISLPDSCITVAVPTPAP